MMGMYGMLVATGVLLAVCTVSFLTLSARQQSNYQQVSPKTGALTSDEATSDDADEFAVLFQKRRHLAAKVCEKHALSPAIDPVRRSKSSDGEVEVEVEGAVFEHDVPFDEIAFRTLLVDERHQLIYCGVPKVASTAWKKFLTAVIAPPGRFSSPDEISDEEINDGNVTKHYLKPLIAYNRTVAQEMLKTYPKMMWVREPLRRLVSAWRSKFARKTRFYSKFFGSHMIRNYRPNVTISEIDRGYPVMLEEFFSYLRDEGFDKADTHWEYFHELCLICKTPLSNWYIGHFENLEPEANYLISKLLTGSKNLTQQWRFPSRSNASVDPRRRRDSFRSNEAELRLLPEKLVAKVASLYRTDYEMFGYPFPVTPNKDAPLAFEPINY